MTFDGVSEDALAAYRRFDELTGGAPRVNSAYRSPEHNARVGGAKNSQHMHGNAFDFDVSGMPVEQRADYINKAREAGFRGVGVYDNALHFDTGPERAWGPSYSRDSLPKWAENALTGAAPHGAPEGRTDGAVNKLALLNAMPKFQNKLNPEDFRYGV